MSLLDGVMRRLGWVKHSELVRVWAKNTELAELQRKSAIHINDLNLSMVANSNRLGCMLDAKSREITKLLMEKSNDAT